MPRHVMPSRPVPCHDIRHPNPSHALQRACSNQSTSMLKFMPCQAFCHPIPCPTLPPGHAASKLKQYIPVLLCNRAGELSVHPLDLHPHLTPPRTASKTVKKRGQNSGLDVPTRPTNRPLHLLTLSQYHITRHAKQQKVANFRD